MDRKIRDLLLTSNPCTKIMSLTSKFYITVFVVSELRKVFTFREDL